MARYLVVAHRTADSPALLDKVRELIDTEPTPPEFVVLTPKRSWTLLDWLAGERRTPIDIARTRTRRTSERLRALGAHVVAARLGNFDPMVAIEDELLAGDFDGVIISTLPQGLSRWLGMDLPARVARTWPHIRVFHVVAPSIWFLDPVSPDSALRTASPATRQRPGRPFRHARL